MSDSPILHIPGVQPGSSDGNTLRWEADTGKWEESTALLIDDSGNVGIGTDAPDTRLSVRGSLNTRVVKFEDGAEVGHRYLGFTSSSNGQGWDINSQGDSGGINGFLTFSTKATERMRIDSAGNVGIGVTDPTTTLSFANNAVISMRDTGGNSRNIINFNASNELDIGAAGAGITAITFGPGAEKMRLDSSGNLLVGKTAASPTTIGCELRADGRVVGSYNNSYPFLAERTTNGAMMQFNIAGALSGQITTTSGGTPSFVAGSDIALKDNVKDMGGELANILALRPVDYTLKASGASASGFIAQEVQEIWPHKVIQEDGDEYLSLADMGDTTARLVKAIQELNAKVEALQSN